MKGCGHMLATGESGPKVAQGQVAPQPSFPTALRTHSPPRPRVFLRQTVSTLLPGAVFGALHISSPRVF